MKIPFNKPYITGKEIEYIKDIFDNELDTAGDGKYTKLVHKWFEENYKVPKVLLTTSGTTALEMAVRLLNLKEGDVVISPSFTFSSTANAILLAKGVKIKFVDIEADTINIDPDKIEKAITSKTKAIMVVHYAGISCDMDKIMALAKKYHLRVIEDAAQAIGSKYKGKYLGTIGDFGCLSFHGTKNIISGEGGALFINNPNVDIFEQAEIIREKGTNRSKFLRGIIDKYTWVDVGGSYLPSDILAAILYAQLEEIGKILKLRLEKYNYYMTNLKDLEVRGLFKLPTIPEGQEHNAHIFYILLPNEQIRDKTMAYLRSRDINAVSHYVPLHSSPVGKKLGNKPEDLPITNTVNSRLLRLPLFSNITHKEIDHVITELKNALT